MNNQQTSSDVTISGAGLVGSLLALALDRYGFTVTLIDQRDWFEELPQSDGRASAIAGDCWQMLNVLGLTSFLKGQKIHGMRVDEAVLDHEKTKFSLQFDDQGETSALLGIMVENHQLRKTLNQALKQSRQIKFAAKNKITSFQSLGGEVTCKLSRREDLTTRLLVSAEGKGSKLKELAGIKTQSSDYAQAGIVCTVSHEQPHEGLAYQWFLPNGPFALLPLQGTQEQPNRSSIVWSEQRDLAAAIMMVDDQEFSSQMQRRFGDVLGKLQIEGGRWSFPLSASIADSFAKDRLVLVGDSAHSIHPLAGQGLNLGVRDVATLTEVLVDARKLGLDFGSDLILANYEGARRFDSSMALGLMDGLNNLFSNSHPPARLLTSIGLPVVNRLESLKAFLVGKAGGQSSNQPKLLKGEEI